MNVLFLDQSGGSGGGQRCLADVISESVERDWSVTVGLPGPGFLMDAALQAGASVLTLPCGPHRDYLRFATDLVRQRRVIADTIRRSAFDLIYVNGPRVLPAAALARHGTPLLFHAHSVPSPRIALRLAGLAAASATTVVCCCRYVASAYAPFVQTSRLCVVPNGVPDTSREQPGSHDKLRMAVIGRIEPAKGQLLAVEALQLMGSRADRCQLELWGSTAASNRSYAESVRRAARGFRVAILGEGDINCILSAIDLLVLPSLNEGMPRVILEAFSAGVPVIAFATGGIPEVITDGETGFLVRDRSAQGLADGLQRILTLTRQNLERITRNARQAWQNEYRADLFRTRVADLMYRTVHSAGRETGTLLRRRHKA